MLAPVLAEAGYDVVYRDMGVDRANGAARDCDLLVVLGGPIGVYETDRYPFLIEEIAAVGERVAAGGRTLGICLGHQLIAASLGAEVAPGPEKEIGWGAVRLTEAGAQSLLAPLAGVPVLHWHGDQAELPPGATLLAGTAICPNQAFAIGERVLGLQFHLEIQPAWIEKWLIGHAVELARAGIETAPIRRDTARFGAGAATTGQAIIRRWLAEGVGQRT